MCLLGLQVAGTEKIKKNETMKFINPKNILFEKKIYTLNKLIDHQEFYYLSPQFGQLSACSHSLSSRTRPPTVKRW